MLMPLDRHCDGGLGATGDIFQHAAEALLTAQEYKRSNHSELPICFLFRHAIELYLKSAILILHRGLKIPYGTKPFDSSGYIKIKNEWKPINTTHSIQNLWDYFNSLVQSNAEQLSKICRTNWAEAPEGLEEAIKKIDILDQNGTFFRYQDERKPSEASMKSEWKEKPLKELEDFNSHTATPIKLLLLTDEEGNAIEAFQYHENPLDDIVNLLTETAHNLSGVHVGLRIELMDGN